MASEGTKSIMEEIRDQSQGIALREAPSHKPIANASQVKVETAQEGDDGILKPFLEPWQKKITPGS